MNKQQQIEEFLKTPIKPGDAVSFKKKNVTVIKVDDQFVYWGWGEPKKIPITDVKRSTSHIGESPFKEVIRIKKYLENIEALLRKSGFNSFTMKHELEPIEGEHICQSCFDPIILNEQGEETTYQKDYVWSLQEKQLLIESIYNHTEIGKFVFRERSWAWVTQRIKNKQFDHTGFFDVVDGKQRLLTLVEFVKSEFKDQHGNVFSELSDVAQRKFLSYNELSSLILPDDISDQNV